MRREAEQEMNDSCDKPNNVFKLEKLLRKKGQDGNGRRCLTGINGRFAFSEKDQKRVWKKHMEKTMNKTNAWSSERDFLGGNNKCNEKNKIRKSIWTFRDELGNDKRKWKSWN